MRATVIENTQVLPNVAFKTPEGKIVLIVANDTWSVIHSGSSTKDSLPE